MSFTRLLFPKGPTNAQLVDENLSRNASMLDVGQRHFKAKLSGGKELVVHLPISAVLDVWPDGDGEKGPWIVSLGGQFKTDRNQFRFFPSAR